MLLRSQINYGGSTNADVAPPPMLPHSVLEHVMSFLCTREQHIMAFSSPVLARSVTMKNVITTAMLSGGRSKKNVEILFDLVNRGCIIPPSALRVLRIVNGKVCEVCCENKVYHLRAPYGVFVCWHCLTKRRKSRIFYKQGPSYQTDAEWYDRLFAHDTVACKFYAFRTLTNDVHSATGRQEERWYRDRGYETRRAYAAGGLRAQVKDLRQYLWHLPMFDGSGERIGPIHTLSEISLVVLHLKQKVGLPFLHNTAEEKAALDDYAASLLLSWSVGQDRQEELTAAYLDCAREASARVHQREWEKKTVSTRWRSTKLSNAIKAVDALKSVVKHPLVKERLVFEVNSRFLNFRPRSNMRLVPRRWRKPGQSYAVRKYDTVRGLTSIVFRDHVVQNILGIFVTKPCFMMKKSVLNMLAEVLEEQLVPSQQG